MFVIIGCGEDKNSVTCEGQSCMENAGCHILDNTPTCLCNSGFHFENNVCIVDSVCSHVSCTQNASCIEQNGIGVCVCNEGYVAEGLICVVEQENPCENITCSNKGTCVVSNNNPVCNCNNGYHAEGLNCVIDEIQNPCDTTNCPAHSTCKVENNEGVCYCEEGYIVNEAKTGCVLPCSEVTCPNNSTCKYENSEEACYCNEGYQPNSAGTGCEAINPDSPFINFNIWRSTDGSQLWGRWESGNNYEISQITVTYPNGQSIRKTYYETPSFNSGYDEVWFLSDNGGFTEGEYTIKFQISTGNGSTVEKTYVRTVENEIYKGTNLFTINSGEIDSFDGLKLNITPSFNGTIQRVNVYSLEGAWLYTKTWSSGVSVTNNISSIISIGGNYTPQTLIISFEGANNAINYMYYSAVEFILE